MAIVNQAIIDNVANAPNNFRYTMLTVPVGEQWAITNILVCNTYNADATTSVVRRLSLPAGETFTFDTERVILEGGDSVVINGEASVGGTGRLACTVSYMKVL
jgi:hypothetical protein